MSKNIDKNISQNPSSKCSQKLVDHGKQSATDAFRTSSRKAMKTRGNN